MNTIRNIALFAHVDAGKTTVTENLLFSSGNIRNKGNVDKGTSQTDFLAIEKEKGISIRAACVSFKKNNFTINLIDTPGHIDFSSETGRTLHAIDGAVLIISAVEGVQSHTETLWQQLQKQNIPTIIFINKIDRAGADTEQVIDEINKVLTKNTIVLQNTENEANDNANIKNIFTDIEPVNEELVEIIAEQDEKLLEKFFDEEIISFSDLKKVLTQSVHQAKLFPIIFGSAKNEIGTQELLGAITDYLPSPRPDNKETKAYIYKVEHDKSLGKVCHIRVFSGTINKRELIYNATQQTEEKIAQIKKVYTQKYIDIEKIDAGDIAIVTGLSKAKAGDFIGSKSFDEKYNLVHEISLLTVKVSAKNSADAPKLLKAFQELEDEDPNLNVQWINELRELHINTKGKIHLEILEELLKNRFDIDAVFDEPAIIYKETPAKPGEGYVRYWMPKPCWAIMRFKIEPAERGAGVIFKSEVSFDKIKQRYQNQIEQALPDALKQGIKGWEVTDIKITLIDGEDHEIHTHPHDFTIATPMGIMDGLKNCDTVLLEPVLSFRITAPEKLLGVIASDLTKMRASFGNPVFENGKVELRGKVPAATSMEYPIRLASISGGKGKITTKFDSYQECALEDGKITEYRGISPLDTAKYILHARNAL
ncbi:MAG: TetM/TetW/TetO/TetS family tetracycline resistance ribosomal protection protein [Bacteroidales bacterium]|nr:TetM/TetW/TetO/TetS family tetracycline resistance ribosomal protection protein [Bacteroidales bacterium]